MSSIWYDKSKLMSKNAFVNFLIGQRGGGKSYGFKTYVIDRYLKHKEQFVWIRRYKTEFEGEDKEDGVLATFMKDIKHLYPKNDIKVSGYSLMIDGEIAGHFIALSTSLRQKSKPFPDVKTIIYDEFVLPPKSNLRYLSNETFIFNELLETITRLRDDVRVVLIGNALTWANPYFMKYNIKPFKSGIQHIKSMSIAIEIYSNEEFSKAKRKTRAGKFYDASDYGAYATDGEFLLDTDTFVEKKTDKAKFRCAIKYDNEVFGFWIDWETGLMYANKQYDPKSNRIYTLKKEDHDVNYLLVKNINATFIRDVVFCFQNGSLRFDNLMVKSKVFDLLSIFIR